ncbi:MAG: SPOR domain-containing protein [Bacteroides sp.]|nr:SPOR domain-containing protein [Roseburia sp.]MCM1346707.1 SPOR domain-containing protein [Bacteroides sp.]MCM1421468.1 SPOR domain-containing protein [Bacteroides sp.]
MMNLSKHIEILLLEHDCVIIPKLGGFIANQMEAHYGSQADNLFAPPYRTIGFNKNLLVNDGLLVQSYMQVYDASYPDAYKQMEMDIDEVLQQLDLNGTFLFEGIGTVHKNIDGNITFESLEKGTLTPGLYGLCALEVKSLSEAKKERELINSIQSTTVLPIQSEGSLSSACISHEHNGEEENVTIRLHRRWLDVSIAAVVAILLFFLFSYPSFRNSSPSDTCVAGSLYVGKENKYSSVGENNPASFSKSVSGKVDGKRMKNEKPQTANDDTDIAQIKEETVQVDTVRALDNEESAFKKEYVLVLASYVSKPNASVFIERLKSEGYSDAEYIRTGKISRIVYSCYSSRDEAADSLSILRKKHSAFKEAWILKI